MVPCTGRVEEALILRGFEEGADGVMVVGCLEGDCHYVKGNLRARQRVNRCIGILDQTGVGGERVRMYNLSAGEGGKFVAYVAEMVDHLARLGRSPINAARLAAPVADGAPERREPTS